MKTSKYNVSFNLNDEENIIFNTLTRKYVVYDKGKGEYIKGLLKETDKEYYELEEANVLKKLINKGIVIKDDYNEMETIKYNERVAMYQDQYFHITIQPTLDCNFRCTYCYENLKDSSLNDATVERIVKLIEKVTKKVNILVIHWFGGEPLLEKDNITYLSEKIREICDKNGCKYRSALITNGYLLSDDVIEELKLLNLIKIQITIDGLAHDHDKSRPLHDGSGTFEKIKENLYKALEHDVYITMRMNVSEKNYNDIDKLFNIVAEEKRKKVIISLANVFQNKEKLDLYPLYRKSIEMGYVLANVFSNPRVCEGASKNSMVIDPEGKISSCSMATEKGIYFGYINEDGDIVSNNNNKYYELRNVLSSEVERCNKCIKLPVCYGGCKLNRVLEGDVCNWGNPTGMSLQDRIRLQYINDKKLGKLDKRSIIS